MTLSLAQAEAQLTAVGAPFEIQTLTIRGIQTRTWQQAPATLRAILQASRNHGEREYLIYEGERLSYAEHYQRVAHLAGQLANRFQIKKGERVAIAMRNYPEWSLTFWAAAAVGAIVVPLNAWWTGAELAYGLQDSGSVVLFADEERLQRLTDYLPDSPLRGVVAVRTDAADMAMSFAELFVDMPAEPLLPEVDLEPEDDATIFYTSGTSGKPKGALATQRNMCTNPISMAYMQALFDLAAGQAPAQPVKRVITLVSVPFFHVTGCHAMLLTAPLTGNTLVLMYRWNPEQALALIERERVTSFGGVPAMVWQVLESPAFNKYDLSSVNSVRYGGAPASPALVTRIRAAFPHVIPRNGYGLTEISCLLSTNSNQFYLAKPDSVGVPIAVCDIKVVAESGKELPTGEVGELWVKGPNVIKGYWNNPQATAAAITDGWLHTGDLARLDEEGFIYIVDRAKDMVIRGGENIYCVEVEDVLYSHPAVMDAAVLGIPDRILGEQVVAVVQIIPAAKTDEQELREYVAEHLAAFKVPIKIVLSEQPLPRNANGKILKRQLRSELFASQ